MVARPDQRAELAQALINACVETLGLRSDHIAVEFTQHMYDEMYRPGRGWGTGRGKVSREKARRGEEDDRGSHVQLVPISGAEIYYVPAH